jgi:predicted DNA-binding transcriptional regulator AlpA
MLSLSWRKLRLTPQRQGNSMSTLQNSSRTLPSLPFTLCVLEGFGLPPRGIQPNTTRRHDRLLKAKEVAQRLGVHVYWVYHNQHKLPFRVRLGTVPRFSEIGLEKFIRSRLGA